MDVCLIVSLVRFLQWFARLFLTSCMTGLPDQCARTTQLAIVAPAYCRAFRSEDLTYTQRPSILLTPSTLILRSLQQGEESRHATGNPMPAHPPRRGHYTQLLALAMDLGSKGAHARSTATRPRPLLQVHLGKARPRSECSVFPCSPSPHHL